MASLALTQGGNVPTTRTPWIFGMRRRMGGPAMASATSAPPAPMANMPSEPAAGVWLSEPTMMSPGLPKRAMWTG